MEAFVGEGGGRGSTAFNPYFRELVELSRCLRYQSVLIFLIIKGVE